MLHITTTLLGGKVPHIHHHRASLEPCACKNDRSITNSCGPKDLNREIASSYYYAVNDVLSHRTSSSNGMYTCRAHDQCSQAAGPGPTALNCGRLTCRTASHRCARTTPPVRRHRRIVYHTTYRTDRAAHWHTYYPHALGASSSSPPSVRPSRSRAAAKRSSANTTRSSRSITRRPRGAED